MIRLTAIALCMFVTLAQAQDYPLLEAKKKEVADGEKALIEARGRVATILSALEAAQAEVSQAANKLALAKTALAKAEKDSLDLALSEEGKALAAFKATVSGGKPKAPQPKVENFEPLPPVSSTIKLPAPKSPTTKNPIVKVTLKDGEKTPLGVAKKLREVGGKAWWAYEDYPNNWFLYENGELLGSWYISQGYYRRYAGNAPSGDPEQQAPVDLPKQ